MKFGVMYDFRNPRGVWWKPYPKLLRELLDQIVAVEGMGYDNIWVSGNRRHDSHDGGIVVVLDKVVAGLS